MGDTTARRSWLDRAIRATDGPRSRLGCIIWAMTGCNDNREKRGKPPIYPCYGPTCIIGADGVVRANFARERDETYIGALVGETAEVRDNLNRLADMIEASDDERLDMFSAFRSWVAVDYRALTTPDEFATVH